MGCGPSSEGQDVWAQNTQKVPTVSPDVLERYIELEEKISASEKDTPAMVLEQKNEQLKQLTIRISEQTKLVEQLKAQAALEKRDVDELEGGTDTHKLFLEQGTLEEKKQKELAEYIDAKNKEEIATKELDSLKEQRNNVDNELRECQYKYEQLQMLYTEQEDLLSQIFGGAYGSEEENRLESIFDQTEEMRNRIIEANFKWRQAQMMVDYAHKQLEFAVQKWKDIDEIDPGALEDRYAVAAETRNNLVAASQNIQGAQRYLSNIQFPYCAPSEVDTLNKATAYIFTDMQTKERHGHALECYYVTSRRCGALLQWITQVVTQTISRDLDDINAKVKEASYNLRAERVRLIKLKVKEVLGKDVDVKIGEFNTDAVVNLNLNDLAKTEGIDPKTLQELNLSEEELAALAALNNGDELAPPPNSDQLFGEKMEAIKKEYEDDNQRYQKLLEKDKAEMNRNLEDKLAARRQRRARKNLEEKEKAVMI